MQRRVTFYCPDACAAVTQIKLARPDVSIFKCRFPEQRQHQETTRRYSAKRRCVAAGKTARRTCRDPAISRAASTNNPY